MYATPQKTTVRPLASHLTNHSSKTNKTCSALPGKQDELISGVLLQTPEHGHQPFCPPYIAMDFAVQFML